MVARRILPAQVQRIWPQPVAFRTTYLKNIHRHFVSHRPTQRNTRCIMGIKEKRCIVGTLKPLTHSPRISVGQDISQRHMCQPPAFVASKSTVESEVIITLMDSRSWILEVVTIRVSRSLTLEHKTERKVISSGLVRFEAEGETFLSWNVTASKTWVRNFEPETKSQSMK
jgi:hypothetical protein